MPKVIEVPADTFRASRQGNSLWAELADGECAWVLSQSWFSESAEKHCLTVVVHFTQPDASHYAITQLCQLACAEFAGGILCSKLITSKPDQDNAKLIKNNIEQYMKTQKKYRFTPPQLDCINARCFSVQGNDIDKNFIPPASVKKHHFSISAWFNTFT